jgi:hypothetical protein
VTHQGEYIWSNSRAYRIGSRLSTDSNYVVHPQHPGLPLWLISVRVDELPITTNRGPLSQQPEGSDTVLAPLFLLHRHPPQRAYYYYVHGILARTS